MFRLGINGFASDFLSLYIYREREREIDRETEREGERSKRKNKEINVTINLLSQEISIGYLCLTWKPLSQNIQITPYSSSITRYCCYPGGLPLTGLVPRQLLLDVRSLQLFTIDLRKLGIQSPWTAVPRFDLLDYDIISSL